MTQGHGSITGKGGEAGMARTQLLLLLLLVVVGALAYLYLFTDIIRPRQEPQPQAAVEQVKQPMPQKPETAPAGPAPAEGVAAPAPPGQPAPPTAASAPPAAPPVTSPQPAASPVAAVPAPAVKPPAVPPKGEAKQPAPAAAKAPDQKPAGAEPKKAAPAPKAASVSPQPKKSPEPAAAAKQKPVAKTAVPGRHLIIVGDYASEALLREARAKVVKAGLTPSVEKGSSSSVTMHRLLVGEYGDKPAADVAMQRVKGAGSSAFVMHEGDQFVVYAGSFKDGAGAAKERQVLASKGIVTVIRTMPVPLAAQRLTAGRFATREEARKAAEKLAKAGLAPRVATLGAK